MRDIIRLFFIFLLFFLVSCGQETSSSLSEQNLFVTFQTISQANGTAVMVTYPRGYPAYRTFPGMNSNSQAMEPPLEIQQSLLTGNISGVAGEVTVEVYRAVACEAGFCADSENSPLARIRSISPGFFSIIVSHHGESLILKGIANDQSRELYLGSLPKRKDGADLNF